MKTNGELVFEMRIDWRNVQRGIRNPTHRPDHLLHDTSPKVPSVFLPVKDINVDSIRNWLDRSHYKMFGRYRYYRGKFQTRIAFEGVLFVFADNCRMRQFQEFCGDNFASVSHITSTQIASIAA